MKQPTKKEITEKLTKVINGESTREEVSIWAQKLIEHDSYGEVEIEDVTAWHYLVTAVSIDLERDLDKYYYGLEDIKNWIEEYTGDNCSCVG